MGSRDYSHHEAKKPKKDSKKLPPISITAPTVEVEVVKKGKKHREGEEVEEE
ncbi:MAG: hypothetical protein Q7R57_07245 [Dehalococcoidales bacterium]|nr:hypothetical protein [Dehalococcoidales bacterium]